MSNVSVSDKSPNFSVPTIAGVQVPAAHKVEQALEMGYFAEILDNLAALINPQSGDEFLDLGCYNGALVRRLAPACKLAVGVTEERETALRASELSWNRHVSGVQFFCAPLNRLPFKLAHFNSVSAVNVLFQRNDPETVIAEMKRVAVPKGQLFFLEPSDLMNAESMDHFISQQGITGYSAQFMVNWGKLAEDKKPRPRQDVEETMISAGLEIVDAKPLMNGLAYIIACKKG